ncbi:MAG: hypothetical protein A2023_04850 [Sulfuricurvum sp. GWF2_44_89]|uniref:glycosyltransferase family 10 domain-containing protein n=1 Tax=unclassified Sulfuricurvum TaxID=2632390 RepID=UPI0008B9E73C|nr:MULTISPECIES: glycosyltransferase family 10 [unclassified Sulfuricurvum]OHD78136.1 MAG: hypothetical protein A2023_04850 [Sulfuricurvum sp. GWF2_44_89]OHD91470.1 MAG: hypothetical protein A2517_09700 [Sulfuricurvum sp. RIFOXYD12_FULL_44_77]OHD92601.1 MAG: hypothetical protein A2552_00845 [Sulfuricurvum sp. RIFOXYD2_FULL_44_160]
MLIRIIKNYKDRDFTTYSPRGSMQWNGIQFTEEPIVFCDGVIVLNTPKKKVSLMCPPENIAVIMQEPYHKGDTDWMDSQLEQYRYVFTNHVPSEVGTNTQIILSHGALPWHVLKTYDELKAINLPMEKDKVISCIASNLTRWPGHKKRVAFIEYLKQHNELGIDFFGKGTQFIEDKWDGIAPYRYSIVIENNDIDHYWTEKISDVFLGFGLPFYFGCTNINHYFPEDSYIWIDISNPEKALETMRIAIEKNEWENRIEAIAEARRRVLDEYNLLPMVAAFAQSHFFEGKRKRIALKPFKYDISTRFKRYIERKKKKLLKLVGK